MRFVLVQVALGILTFLGLAGFLLEPQSKSQARGSESTAPSAAMLDSYNASAVWFQPDDVEAVRQVCTGNVQACMRQAIVLSKAPQAALDFFDANQSVLLGFVAGAPVAVGRAEPSTGRDVGPTLAFLNGATQFQWVDDALRATFDVTPEHPERALSSDPMYAALLAALPSFSTPGVDVVPFASEEQRLESITTLPSGDEEVVVQIGVDQGCVNCGTGIAERYAFDFGPEGRLSGVKLLGLCEGGRVPGGAAPDGHSYVMQEYGGTQFFHLAGAPMCPAHSPL